MKNLLYFERVCVFVFNLNLGYCSLFTLKGDHINWGRNCQSSLQIQPMPVANTLH